MGNTLPKSIRLVVEHLVEEVQQEPVDSLHIRRLNGGANNQVFRVDCGTSVYCLKRYFSHPQDDRNRLEHEFQFSRYAWESGILNIPQPLAQDVTHHLALYDFIPGRKLSPSEIGHAPVQSAIQFLTDLNLNCQSVSGKQLAWASEACTHWADHIDRIEHRVLALQDLPLETPIHAEAFDFIQNQLNPVWRHLNSKYADLKIPRSGSSLGFPFHILSPSDFGFHNALLTPQDILYFLDFEYAGWDDPIKLVCDFFHQPEIPVPASYLDEMVSALASFTSEDWRLEDRVRLLLPGYGVKWCCILLNDFLPVGESRRRFSQQVSPSPTQLAEQLIKARRKLGVVLEFEDEL